MGPNLFNFGTGELTHDAILSWILAWGKYKDRPLYNLSRDFIKLLTNESIEIEKIDIRQQENKIDIMAIINEEIVIVIEDKIDTGAGDGQLRRYKEIVDKKYSDKKRFYSYVTVGDECNYKDIIDAGYRLVERKDLLSLIRKYKKDSKILEDYHAYLSQIEESFNSYKNQDLISWTPRGWQGFFKELNKRFKDGSWAYVPNESGGFLAFYWEFNDYMYKDEIAYTIYLQIEQGYKIAFKVRVSDEKYLSEIRNYLWDNLKDIIGENSLIQRPLRFGYGKTMTYGEIKDYKTKGDLYNAIQLAEETHRKLKAGMFNLNLKPKSPIEDVCLINGKIPKQKINSNIIFVSNINKKELKDFIERESGYVFVFANEYSMDKCRDLFLRSKEFLDSGSNMADLIHLYASKNDEIRTLEYISVLDNIKRKNRTIIFSNEEPTENYRKALNTGQHIWVLKDEKDDNDIEGFYILED